MNEVGEKFLPIGTVVMLKGGTKRAMITGFCSIAQEQPDKMYDYSGCIYPEGYISSNQVCLFDHSQIEKVYHMGLVDEEEKEFKVRLNKILSENDVEAILKNNAAHSKQEEAPAGSEVPEMPTTQTTQEQPNNNSINASGNQVQTASAPVTPSVSEVPPMPTFDIPNQNSEN